MENVQVVFLDMDLIHQRRNVLHAQSENIQMIIKHVNHVQIINIIQQQGKANVLNVQKSVKHVTRKLATV